MWTLELIDRGTNVKVALSPVEITKIIRRSLMIRIRQEAVESRARRLVHTFDSRRLGGGGEGADRKGREKHK